MPIEDAKQLATAIVADPEFTAALAKLKPKHQRFTLEYLRTGNACKSYEFAYDVPYDKRRKPGDKSTRQGKKAHLVAHNPAVQAALAVYSRLMAVAVTIEKAEAVTVLSEISRARIGTFIAEGGDVDVAAVRRAGPEVAEYTVAYGGGEGRVSYKIKLRDPIAAIERLAKMLGWDVATTKDGNRITAVFNINTAEPAAKAAKPNTPAVDVANLIGATPATPGTADGSKEAR